MNDPADVDPYAPTAPYYDLLATSFWDVLGPALSEALAGTNPLAGPIVDLGAGTGRSTLVIADAVADAEVWAVEPSASMRAMLLAHLALRPDLHARVTALADDVAGLAWPQQIAAAVACNMIGHLDANARSALWARVALHLAPGGVAVVGLQPPARPERIEATPMAEVTIGRHTYQGVAEAEPTGERSMHWTMTYRTIAGDTVVHEAVKSSDWWTVGCDDVVAEAALAGLSVSPAAADLLVMRRTDR